MTKNLVSGPILAQLAQIQTAKIFFKNPDSSVTRCHGQLSSCTISEKTNDPIFGQMDRQKTDRQAEGQGDRWTAVIS